MLNNPSFENMGWVANSSCTGAFDSSKKRSGSYSLKVTSTSSSESLIVTTDSYKITKNHIYYVRVYIYQNTAGDVGAMQCYWPIAEPLMGTCNTNNSFIKKWQMMSWYNTRSNWSTGGNYQFRFDFENMASGKVAWIDDAMLIDLTECFGSGNEPDKTWCDSNIPYFEKTYIYGTKLSIKTSTWKDLSSGLIKIPTIPQTYTPLEYIESTGTQYIDTGLTVNKTDSYEMILITHLTNNDNWAGANGYLQFQAKIGNNKKSKIDIKYINKIETIFVDDQQVSLTDWSTSYNGTNVKLGIFRLGDTNNTQYSQIGQSGKLYSCKILNNNNLIRNFIPCKNISGILGLYDIVNNIFYTNAGTGTFTAGPIATASWVKIGNL